jgi:hypothetical protein
LSSASLADGPVDHGGEGEPFNRYVLQLADQFYRATLGPGKKVVQEVPGLPHIVSSPNDRYLGVGHIHSGPDDFEFVDDPGLEPFFGHIELALSLLQRRFGHLHESIRQQEAVERFVDPELDLSFGATHVVFALYEAVLRDLNRSRDFTPAEQELIHCCSDRVVVVNLGLNNAFQ